MGVKIMLCYYFMRVRIRRLIITPLMGGVFVVLEFGFG